MAPETTERARKDRDPTPASDGKPPAYAIFEGGGARGITHVGALKALRERYWVVGAAGASAGAIVAALAAVGYEADEIFDATHRTDILTRHGTSPTRLLGRVRWQVVSNAVRTLPGTMALAFWSLSAFAFLCWLDAEPRWRLLTLAPLFILLASISIPGVPILLTGGAFQTARLRDMLDRLLRTRLEEHYHRHGINRTIGDYVTFEDMSPLTVPDTCRLRIIVTDASNGKLLQFDERTGGASVADAVAASAALPLVFQPPDIRGFPKGATSVFVDGGLVSNLPVWAFVSEKKMFERGREGGAVPIFAFQLKTPPRNAIRRSEKMPSGTDSAFPIGHALVSILLIPWTLLWRLPRWISLEALGILGAAWSFLSSSNFSIGRHLADVIRSGIFGSQTVVQDFVSDLRIIEMESPLRTAEFGCSRHRATLAYAAGYDRASACLATWSLEQEQIQKLLDEALPEVEQLMIECRQARGDLRVPRLRISIVDPTPSGAFKVAASAGMTADADDRMEYDPRNAAAPAAYLGKIATNVSYVRSTPWIGEIMTKYERALLPGSRQWVISVPVSRLVDGGIPSDLAARDVIRVLCIDSDDDLRPDFADPKLMNWLGEETVLFIPS